jgi:hypothetical protein
VQKYVIFLISIPQLRKNISSPYLLHTYTRLLKVVGNWAYTLYIHYNIRTREEFNIFHRNEEDGITTKLTAPTATTMDFQIPN